MIGRMEGDRRQKYILLYENEKRHVCMDIDGLCNDYVVIIWRMFK
jgi:hypothetical protein